MAIDTSSHYSFSMEDLLNLPDFNLDLDDFTVDTPSSDSNSQSQRSDEQQQQTHASSPSSPAYACINNGCSCGATFRRPSQLKKHVEQRTRPHACTQDGCTVRPFSSKHDLNRHEREVHGCAAAGGRVVRLRCPYTSCKRHHRGFGRKENLALHMRTMHPDGSTSASAASSSSPETMVAEREVLPLPAVAAPIVTAVAAPRAVSANAAETALQVALQDRLAFLQAHREALARQLQAVDEQITAVQCTVSGLQGFNLDLGLGGEGLLLK